MSASPAADISEDRILETIAAIRASAPEVTPIGGGLMAALHLGIAKDSRTFSRLLGIAHALVLREIADLTERDRLIRVVYRNSRTQRTEFAFTESGEALVEQATAA